MKTLRLAFLASMIFLPALSPASDLANAEAALDAKAGILGREWRIAKIAPRHSLMLPKQLRFGLPPVEQQVFDAQASPKSLVESLTPPPVVPVQVPASVPVSSSGVVPGSGPQCTTIITPNGSFTKCTP